MYALDPNFTLSIVFSVCIIFIPNSERELWIQARVGIKVILRIIIFLWMGKGNVCASSSRNQILKHALIQQIQFVRFKNIFT